MVRFQWTDKNVKTLKDGWAAGMSASILGAAMGVSRCAILGKARRLKLKPRIDMAMRLATRVEREEAQAARIERKNRAIALNLPVSYGFTARPQTPEMTKGELRALLTQAVRNTAEMAV